MAFRKNGFRPGLVYFFLANHILENAKLHVLFLKRITKSDIGDNQEKRQGKSSKFTKDQSPTSYPNSC